MGEEGNIFDARELFFIRIIVSVHRKTVIFVIASASKEDMLRQEILFTFTLNFIITLDFNLWNYNKGRTFGKH